MALTSFIVVHGKEKSQFSFRVDVEAICTTVSWRDGSCWCEESFELSILSSQPLKHSKYQPIYALQLLFSFRMKNRKGFFGNLRVFHR